jgi:hypothetical protein
MAPAVFFEAAFFDAAFIKAACIRLARLQWMRAVSPAKRTSGGGDRQLVGLAVHRWRCA